MNYGFTPDPGENILRVIHRDPITLFPSLAAGIVMVFLSFALAYIGGRFPATVPHGELLTTLLALILAVIGVLVFVISIFVYRRNVLIFTSIHLIEVEQTGLFNHRVSQVDFRRVQDVSGARAGIWQTLFNFGDVEVQSAGEQEKFIFHGVRNPALIADDALQTRDDCMKAANAKGTPLPGSDE